MSGLERYTRKPKRRRTLQAVDEEEIDVLPPKSSNTAWQAMVNQDIREWTTLDAEDLPAVDDSQAELLAEYKTQLEDVRFKEHDDFVKSNFGDLQPPSQISSQPPSQPLPDQLFSQREETEVQIVYRDASGVPISREQWEALNRKPDSRPKAEWKTAEWGTGLKQREDEALRAAEEALIHQGGFARQEIDESLDRELREQLLWDDPMYAMLKVSQEEEGGKPSCPFPSPPNRFSISAGYRWDGVIRGNGFEEKYMQAYASKLHTSHS